MLLLVTKYTGANSSRSVKVYKVSNQLTFCDRNKFGEWYRTLKLQDWWVSSEHDMFYLFYLQVVQNQKFRRRCLVLEALCAGIHHWLIALPVIDVALIRHFKVCWKVNLIQCVVFFSVLFDLSDENHLTQNRKSPFLHVSHAPM